MIIIIIIIIISVNNSNDNTSKIKKKDKNNIYYTNLIKGYTYIYCICVKNKYIHQSY